MALFTTLALSGMALGRVAIGLAPFVAPRASSRMLGFPAAHDTATARLMARLFGVRDIGLGVLVIWAVMYPEALPFVILFNAATDLADLGAISIPLVKREGIDRAAIASALFALGGMTGWIVMYLFAR